MSRPLGLLCVCLNLLVAVQENEASRPERPEASDLSNILDDDTTTSRDRASFVGALVSPLKEEEKEDPSLSATSATSATSASSSTLELPPTLEELNEKSSTGEVEELPVMYKNRRKLCKVKAKDMVDVRSLVQGSWEKQTLAPAALLKDGQCDIFSTAEIRISTHDHLASLPKVYGGMSNYVPGKLKTKPPKHTPLKELPEKYFSPPCGGGSNSASYIPKRWNMKKDGPKLIDAKRFYDKIANKHLAFIGDSTMRQLMLGMACHLADAGFKPTKIMFSEKLETQFTYANGLVISRWGLLELNYFHSEKLSMEAAEADAVILNMGRHYRHTPKGIKEYSTDIKKVVNLVANVADHVFLTDTLPSHFASASGDLFDKKGASHAKVRGKGYACKVVKDPVSKNGGQWRNTLMRQSAEHDGLSVLPFYKILQERYDAHLGERTFGPIGSKAKVDPDRMDCVHWCYSKTMFEPLVIQMQHAFVAALEGSTMCHQEILKGAKKT